MPQQQDGQEVPESEKTLNSSAEPMQNSFWVVERFEDGRSAGYWDGANSRSFQSEIGKAIQFRRKEDAFWATRGWHWKDVRLTEHLYMSALGESTREFVDRGESAELEQNQAGMSSVKGDVLTAPPLSNERSTNTSVLPRQQPHSDTYERHLDANGYAKPKTAKGLSEFEYNYDKPSDREAGTERRIDPRYRKEPNAYLLCYPDRRNPAEGQSMKPTSNRSQTYPADKPRLYRKYLSDCSVQVLNDDDTVEMWDVPVNGVTEKWLCYQQSEGTWVCILQP